MKSDSCLPTGGPPFGPFTDALRAGRMTGKVRRVPSPHAARLRNSPPLKRWASLGAGGRAALKNADCLGQADIVGCSKFRGRSGPGAEGSTRRGGSWVTTREPCQNLQRALRARDHQQRRFVRESARAGASMSFDVGRYETILGSERPMPGKWTTNMHETSVETRIEISVMTEIARQPSEPPR
jgi:hypothetical protein